MLLKHYCKPFTNYEVILERNEMQLQIFRMCVRARMRLCTCLFQNTV